MSQEPTTRTQTVGLVSTRDDCRMCASRDLTKIWSFGPTPLANEYILPEEAGRNQPAVPLDVYKCDACHLVQLRDVVDPSVLFKHYLYVSSTSPTFVAHFEEYADTLQQRFALTANDLVVDIGSNDGVLLKPLQRAGIRVLGVDPAEAIAHQATADGIETLAAFFTPDVAREIANQHGQAKIITANNMFAHTDAVGEVVEAVQELLTDDGIFVFEVQYLGDLLANTLFDIVYHEHVCYYHVHPLVSFFESKQMDVFDVERVSVHGGSIRVYVQRAGGRQPHSTRLANLLTEEIAAGLHTLAPYQALYRKVTENKQALQAILAAVASQGKRLAGYGAPAKATTFMYTFGINEGILDYVVDDAPLKQGRLMPGSHIPIVSSADFKQDPPDYCLILAWNFADPIMKNNTFFTDGGGQWIVPVPIPRVV